MDAIATIRGVFPLHYFRLSPAREFYYKARKLLGRERRRRDLSDVCTRKRTFTIRRFRGSIDRRDLSHICTRNRTSDESRFFRTAQFLATNGFRPETSIFFANHHAAHALAALFYTDWDDALIYTADGIGDNISCSIRTLRNHRLELAFGDDRLLARPRPTHNSLATAYGYATRRDFSNWARGLFWLLLALIGFGIVLIFVNIPGGNLIYAVLGLVLFGAYTIFDFNRLRRANMDASVPIAAGIFLDIFNIFLFFLQIFGGSSR